MTAYDLNISFAARSEIGARENQEDFYYVDQQFTNDDFCKNGTLLSIVADGMGGHENGELASQLAVHTFRESFYESADQYALNDMQALLNACINKANNAVIDEAKKLNQLGNMGNTLCAVAINKSTLCWVSTGDSRVYRIRNGKMALLSRDFNLEQDIREGVEKGTLNEDLLENNDQLHALTSYIGLNESFRHATNIEAFEEGDCFLICSDGVYDTVDEDVIASLSSDLDAPEIVNKIFDEHLLPNMDDDQDNATAVVIKIHKYQIDAPTEIFDQNHEKTKRSRWKVALMGVSVSLIILALAFGVYTIKKPVVAGHSSVTVSAP